MVRFSKYKKDRFCRNSSAFFDFSVMKLLERTRDMPKPIFPPLCTARWRHIPCVNVPRPLKCSTGFRVSMNLHVSLNVDETRDHLPISRRAMLILSITDIK